MSDAKSELDRLTAAFFAAFDNRKGRPDPGLRGLFVPGAVIVKREAGQVVEMTVETFVAPREALLTSGRLTDFHEWETEHETIVSGGLATRVGRYRKDGMMDGAPYAGGGVKHLSFVLTPAGWRIASLLWEDDA